MMNIQSKKTFTSNVYICNTYSYYNDFFLNYNKNEPTILQIFDRHTSPSSVIVPRLSLGLAI